MSQRFMLISDSNDGDVTIEAGPFGAFTTATLDSSSWGFWQGLMLADGNNFQWLMDANDWGAEFANLMDVDSLESDTQDEDEQVRTSTFNVPNDPLNSLPADLGVSLTQETPSEGYNFVQTYAFTNSAETSVELKAVLWNDMDLELDLDFRNNRIGFVPGGVPRAYFIDDGDVGGDDAPGVADRDLRISVIPRMGEGVTFDGYLGIGAVDGGAARLHQYLQRNLGIASEELNTIQELLRPTGTTEGELTGVNLDTDGDALIDEPRDVSAAIQFSLAIPAGQTVSLGFNYVGGSLSNAIFPLEGDFVVRLKPGDADQDLDFDQLDLVKVQIASKYLTGQAATWGEGDWDGAPGGEQGSPPAGNGLFDQIDIISALGANIYLTGRYGAVADNGVANDGQTSVTYDPNTGEVGIDAPAGTELTSINIVSAAGIFTGDAAASLGGSFDNDADDNIFKATFGSSFGSLSFGNVAQSGLTRDFILGDWTVVGSLAGGGDLGNVDLVYVPEPSTIGLFALGLLVGLRRFTRTPV
jgi:hypothetical protein